MHPSRKAYVEEEAEVRSPLQCSKTPIRAQRFELTANRSADWTPFAQDRGGIALEDVRKYISITPDHYLASAETKTATDYNYDIPSASSGIAPEKASAILSQFERKRLAASVAVPTDDGRVRAKLREFGEPITLFGEGLADRRDRLRELLTVQAEQATQGNGDVQMEDAPEDESQAEEEEEEFYTRGSDELLQARIDITKFSLPRAKQRIAFQKKESTIPLRAHVQHRKQIKERLHAFELQGSQITGDRHVSMVRISPNSDVIATGDWGGRVQLFDTSLTPLKTFRGHTGKISGLDWLPGSTLPENNISPDSVNLASGGGEGQVHLWSLNQETPLTTLSGHLQRVCRVEFHPSGKYLVSASDDCSFRYWDVNTGTELLLQEGHSRGVFAVSHSPDGSLLASGGHDSIARIWDLRSGRCIMILSENGHIQPIYALDWSSDGFSLLSGAADGFIKQFDIRKTRFAGHIGAHNSVVSDLRWYKGLDDPLSGIPPGQDEKGAQLPKKSSTFFVSSGFDKTVKIHSANDFSLIQSLSGHTAPVASVDVARNGRYIVSVGHDRSVKIWGPPEGAEGV